MTHPVGRTLNPMGDAAVGVGVNDLQQIAHA